MKNEIYESLRDYQRVALNEVWKRHRDGDTRQVLASPTGSGKTVMAFAYAGKRMEQGERVLFLTERNALSDQTFEAATLAGLPSGLLQGSNSANTRAPFLVASQQTLEARNIGLKGYGLVVLDECHVQRSYITKEIREHPGLTLGLSATPFTDGLGKTYDGVVSGGTYDSLIRDGYLVGLRPFAVENIDTKNLVTNGGEWTAASVEDAVSEPLRGRIVEHFFDVAVPLFGGTPKTLVFAPTIAMAEDLAQRFNARGVKAVSTTSADSQSQGAAAVAGFRDGSVEVLVSVERLSRGFDVPGVEVLISARPYKASFASHVQQVGRGMRTAPGKEECLLFDHAGNFVRFYSEWQELCREGVRGLDDFAAAKRKEGGNGNGTAPGWNCPKCAERNPLRAEKCIYCDVARPAPVITPETVETLVELNLDMPDNRSEIWEQIVGAAREKEQRNLERYGKEKSYQAWARMFYKKMVGVWAAEAVYRYGEGVQPGMAISALVKRADRDYRRSRVQSAEKPEWTKDGKARLCQDCRNRYHNPEYERCYDCSKKERSL